MNLANLLYFACGAAVSGLLAYQAGRIVEGRRWKKRSDNEDRWSELADRRIAESTWSETTTKHYRPMSREQKAGVSE